RTQVAAPAHHVLGAAELDHAAAGFAVGAAHGVDDLADAETVGAETVRVDVHLVLPNVAAERGHVGDAVHGLQVIPQVPVLRRPQVGEAVRAGCVDQHVLHHPAEAGRVGPEFGGDAGRQTRDHRR